MSALANPAIGWIGPLSKSEVRHASPVTAEPYKSPRCFIALSYAVKISLGEVKDSEIIFGIFSNTKYHKNSSMFGVSQYHLAVVAAKSNKIFISRSVK